MPLDDMYQAGTDAALRNLAQLPPVTPRPDPGFSFWGLLKAPATGAGEGIADVGGFWSEVAGAMGEVEASYNYSGMLPVGVAREVEWRPEDADPARQRLLSGEAFSNPIADKVREAGRWLGPNPETASTAEQVVHNLFRTVTKAVGYSVATGNPYTGALLTGADEGVRASDELRREGVDFDTRSGVGLVTGVSTGVGVALPVAGRTLAGTAGYAVAGGPALFVAQQQMTRDILNNADYSNLADQYDPFDPVGLAVSTLLPLAFGGYAYRGRARAAQRAGDQPRTDAPEAQAQQTPQEPAATGASRDVEDAARVQAVRDVVDSWNLADPADVRAANDALLSVMRASAQLADGVPVSVADTYPMPQAAAARALEQMIGRAEAARAELLPQAEALADKGAIRAMRAEVDALRQQAAPASEAAVRAQADTIRAARPQTKARAAIEEARRQLAAQAQDAEARITRLESQIDANADAVEARRALAVLDEQLAQMRAERAAIDAPASGLAPVAAAVREAFQPARIPQRGRAASPESAPDAAAAVVPGEAAVSVAAGARPGVEPVVPPQPLAAGTADAARQAHVAGRVAEMQAADPDTPVRPDGATEDVPLSEALRQMDEELARADADADLLAVAAACAARAL